MSDEIVCIGEILWDALPDGLFLGGAPFNVARHLHALGEPVAFVSRVGDDPLGREARRRLRAQGLDDALVQTDDTLPTGFVRVALDADSGEPDYEIVEPAAWDAITGTDALERRAEQADALVYGSLAQRATPSRHTIRRLWATDALCVFDVNLRPPFDDRAIVEPSLHAADVVKLNDAELDRMRAWFGLSDGAEATMADLADVFGCRAVCVTGGADGARLWREGECRHHPGHAVAVEDTVGAGDAFLSALLAGLLDGRTGTALLDLANRLGAYVAARSGASPAYEVASLDDIRNLPLDPSDGPA
jgi:Sugar kinases, ribokinase family